MDEMEEAFISAVKDKVQDDPWDTFINRCEELLVSYGIVDELARTYLAGNPADVFANSAN